MLRVVIDTNLLVASAYSPRSTSRRILQACVAGELAPVVSNALLAEYEQIVPQAARRRNPREIIDSLAAAAERVQPRHVRRLVPDDPDDDKLVALALEAGVDALVTNDRGLLWLDPLHAGEGRELRIVTPGTFVREIWRP